MMKTKITSNHAGIEDDNFDFNSVRFIEPHNDHESLIAKCMDNDYVVVLHLSQEVKDLIINDNLDNRSVQELYLKHSVLPSANKKRGNMSKPIDLSD